MVRWFTMVPMTYRMSYHSALIRTGEYIRGYRDADRFMAYCRQCGRYGNCWACPPFGDDPVRTLARYDFMYILGVTVTPERVSECDSKRDGDPGFRLLNDVRPGIDAKLLNLEKLHSGARALFAGTCLLCPERSCTRTAGRPCIHPGQVRPSLEAFGFDIGRTAADLLGIELIWGRDGRPPDYYTLVSGLMCSAPVDGIEW